MYAPLNCIARRSPVIVLAAACAVALAGCDTASDSSNRAARADLRNAEYALAEGAELEKVVSLLSPIAGSGEILPELRVRAAGVLGQTLLQKARENTSQIDRLERDQQVLCLEIAQLASQARQADLVAKGYQKFDPSKPMAESAGGMAISILDQIKERQAAAQGGAGRDVWFTTEGAEFQTLAAISQDVSRLDGEIARVNEQIAAQATQRDAAISSAEAAGREAETATGRAAVDAFIKSSNDRRAASELGTQIEVLTRSKERLEAERRLAAARQQYVDNAVQQLAAEAEKVQSSWSSMQTSARAQNETVVRLISSNQAVPMSVAPAATEGETPDTKPETYADLLPAASVTAKANKLAELSKSAGDLREETLTLLNDAAKFLDDAVTAADAGRTGIATTEGAQPNASPSQKSAWNSAKNAFSAAPYRVQRAEALRMVATLHARHATLLDAREKALGLAAMVAREAAVDVAGTTLASDTIAAERAKALQEAEAAFTASDELLSTVVDAGANTDSEKSAAESARVGRIFGLYAWSQLYGPINLDASGQPVGDRDKESFKRLENARAEVTLAIDANIALPPLPDELVATAETALKAKSAAEAPAASPTTEPTEAPAAEKAAEEKPPEEKPADEKPGEEKPPEEKPAGDKPPG